MVSCNTRRGVYMSILNVIQGEVDPTSIHKALQTYPRTFYGGVHHMGACFYPSRIIQEITIHTNRSPCERFNDGQSYINPYIIFSSLKTI